MAILTLLPIGARILVFPKTRWLPFKKQSTESFVKIAHVNHAKVFVDEKKGTPEEWEQILKWGTDGIQTDNPAALIEYLKKRNK